MWFRMHCEVIDSRKVQTLPAEVFRFWVTCLSLAKKNDGQLPPVDDIVFRLRKPKKVIDSMLTVLVDAKLIDSTDGQLVMHDWDVWQPKSDVSSNRVKQFRKRRVKPFHPVSGNGNSLLCSVSDSALGMQGEGLDDIGKRMIARHEKKDAPAMLLNALLDATAGAMNPIAAAREIEANHAAWCRYWKSESTAVKFLPKLYAWVQDGTCRMPPPDDGNVSTGPHPSMILR